jgi:phospholipid N-methyltransferase
LARGIRGILAAADLSSRVELFTGSAATLLSALGQKQKPHFIISGIPLGNLGGAKALALIDIIYEALDEGGMYIQFQHSLLDRKKIRTRFSNLRTVPAFLNFPPAVVYYAQR